MNYKSNINRPVLFEATYVNVHGSTYLSEAY